MKLNRTSLEQQITSMINSLSELHDAVNNFGPTEHPAAACVRVVVGVRAEVIVEHLGHLRNAIEEMISETLLDSIDIFEKEKPLSRVRRKRGRGR